MYLYGRGYNPLGHIQSGNIYIEEENSCRLGGHENMLLKFRARLYKTCENLKCLDDIDVIMFGKWVWHVMWLQIVALNSEFAVKTSRSCDLRDECWQGVVSIGSTRGRLQMCTR